MRTKLRVGLSVLILLLIGAVVVGVAVHGSSKPSPVPSPKAVDWLFAVDVTTKDFGFGDNLEMRLKQLSTLAEKTKGKPVAIVVQTASINADKKYEINRYVIAEGSVTKIDTISSEGLGVDVKNLLSFAIKRFKPTEVVLMIDSHGSGNGGLAGDSGRATMAELVEFIKQGLSGNKLSLLDFDSCLMGQADGVLDKLHTITEHVVASAETEGGLGQDLAGPIQRVINNPKMTISELGAFMVENARMQGVAKDMPREKPPTDDSAPLFHYRQQGKTKGDTERKSVPVKTLAHYDLSTYKAFRKDLDRFGEALAKAVKDPKNRAAIDGALAKAPAYGSWGVKRDLKAFVEAVLDAVAKNKLADSDDEIRIHGGRLLEDHKRLVVSYSGFYEYASRGGLSIFAADRKFIDFHREARGLNPAGTFHDACMNPPDLSEKKDEFVQKLEKQVKEMFEEVSKAKEVPQDWTDEAQEKLQVAQAAVKSLRNADNVRETYHAMAVLKEAAVKLENTEFYQNMLQDRKRSLKSWLDRYFQGELVQSESGWGKFQEALRRLD